MKVTPMKAAPSTRIASSTLSEQLHADSLAKLEVCAYEEESRRHADLALRVALKGDRRHCVASSNPGLCRGLKGAAARVNTLQSSGKFFELTDS
jgi:hypothetical protein